MKQLKRIRDCMNIPGRFTPGKHNSIADVKGVTAGHCTIIEGDNIRTGVTIIKPHDKDPYLVKTPCAVFVGNGHGKLTGSIQVEEFGELESLIGLTNTLSICQVVQGILNYHIPRMPASDRSINILVGETNDGNLNDIKGCHVKPEHVARAIAACSEVVEEGCVGAGTGISCYGFKSGIGTSSRVISGNTIGEKDNYTIGALVQANFVGNLNIYGHQLPLQDLPIIEAQGSCMIIVATDAPLDAKQLKRIAERGILGMASTGSYMNHYSGDFCIAFSNFPGNLRRSDERNKRVFTRLADGQLNNFYEATVDAVRESVYNTLTKSDDMTGYMGRSVKRFHIEDYKHIIPLK